MVGTLFLLTGMAAGAAAVILFNRVRRKRLSGKFIGKLEAGEPDPTRP